MIMSGVHAGDIAYYREDGLIVRVFVVFGEKDGKGVGYTLEIIDIIRSCKYGKALDPKIGQRFDVWRASDAGAYAGWHLSREL